jgi:hypothetical protein
MILSQCHFVTFQFKLYRPLCCVIVLSSHMQHLFFRHLSLCSLFSYDYWIGSMSELCSMPTASE